MKEFSPMNVSMLNTNVQDKQGVFQDYYGTSAAVLYSHADQLDPNKAQRLTDRVDREMLHRLADRYNLKTEQETVNFYMRHMARANEVIDYVIGRTFPKGFEEVFGIRNEIAYYPESPTDRIMQIHSGAEDEVERFELVRQLFLADISAHFDLRAQDSKLYQSLSGLQKIFNAELYQRGQRQTQEIGSWHDDLTNKFVGTDDTVNQADQNIHRKQLFMHTRQVDGIGGVLTQPRSKSISKIVKVWDKAMRNGGNIDPATHVTDLTGMMFTAMGGPKQRDGLVNRVTTILDQRGAQIVDDSQIDGRSDSNLSWRRVQVTLAGSTEPIELIFHSLESYINYRFHIGQLDRPTPDRAHSLYEHMRTRNVIPSFFPEEVYTEAYQSVNVEAAMDLQMYHIVEDLRNSRRSVELARDEE